ncbi:MAG: hypothetical protein OXH52_18540 [Gammaproteobacteria bacterium]|nr:hypothetical protein [Gammaproteobacteria bacterium]
MADRFDAYCREKGYKKSPLIARLVREYLDREAVNVQRDLFNREQQESTELCGTASSRTSCQGFRRADDHEYSIFFPGAVDSRSVSAQRDSR